MNPIAFYIPCEVQPKQSFRAAVIPNKGGKGFHTRSYQPAKVTESAKMLAVFAAAHRPDEPLKGALSLSLVFLYPWRKTEPKRNRARKSLPKDTSPDCDNLAKQLVDVLQKVGFFRNDAQISELRIRKRWSDQFGISVLLKDDPGDDDTPTTH